MSPVVLDPAARPPHQHEEWQILTDGHSRWCGACGESLPVVRPVCEDCGEPPDARFDRHHGDLLCEACADRRDDDLSRRSV